MSLQGMVYAPSGETVQAGYALCEAVIHRQYGRELPMAVRTQPPVAQLAAPRPAWTLLSNHGRVLACLARQPRMRIRDLAENVGITERACYRILGDLVSEGLLRRERVGRNNRYMVELAAAETHPCSEGMQVGSLLDTG